MTADKTDMLRSGLTPMSFRTEFPDYPVDQMPTLPEGFADCSWCNDACPYFWHEGKLLGVFIDYPDKADRENEGEVARFLLVKTDEHGGAGERVAESEDLADIIAAIGAQP
jgi:hypothetical protein